MPTQKPRKQSKSKSSNTKSNAESVPLVLSRAITESVKRINNSRGAKALGIRTTKTDFYSNLAPHVRVIEKRISHFIRKQTRTKRKPKVAPVADTGDNP